MNIINFAKKVFLRFEFIINLKNYLNNISSVYYLSKNAKKKRKTNDNIRVAFIVYEPAMWDKQEPIYNEFKKYDFVNVTLIVVPDIASNIEEQKEKVLFFSENYDNVLAVGLNADKKIVLDSYDYIFYQTPYCFKYPKSIQPQKTVKYSKICFIPYAYIGSDDFLEVSSKQDFFRNVYFGFMDSETMKDLLYDKYKKNCEKKIQNFEFLGYPSLEYYINLKRKENISKILWAPRWSYAEVGGGSHFLAYKQKIIDLSNNYKEKSFTLRPHPLMFSTLISQSLMSVEAVKEYKENLKKAKVILDENSLLNIALSEADILICDYSSIIINFFLTGKPIVYCDSNIKFSGVYERIRECLYIVNTWEEAEKCVDELIKGNDPLKEKREELIAKEFEEHINSAKKITERIIEDAKS